MMHDADNADDMYDNIVMPFKGQLEEWYVQNRSFVLYNSYYINYLCCNFGKNTIFVIRIFSSTPRVPDALKRYI